MTSYERTLDEFAEGKNLVRLSRPVRDRADASCDACGSTQPRTLYALKNQDSGRYFFVGDTCLKELVKRGVIRRRFGKESGQVAFDQEMQHRSEESGDGSGLQDRSGDLETSTVDSQLNPLSGLPAMVPSLLVLEGPEYYEAFAHVSTEQGATGSTGYATEARYEEVWCPSGPRGMLLEKVRRARPAALRQAITDALHEAASRSNEREAPASDGDEKGSPALPLPLLDLLELVTRARSSQHSSGASGDGALASIPRDGTSL